MNAISEFVYRLSNLNIIPTQDVSDTKLPHVAYNFLHLFRPSRIEFVSESVAVCAKLRRMSPLIFDIRVKLVANPRCNVIS